LNLQELSVENVRAEIADNFRLRIGLWSVLGIFLVWVSLVWSDVNAMLYQSIKEQQQVYVRLQDIEGEDIWQGRLSEVQAKVSQLETKLWSADSEGLAKAKIQSELATLTKPSGVEKQVIKVGSPQLLEDFQGVSRVRARVGVTLQSDELHTLLNNLDSSEKLLVVDQLNFKFIRGKWNIELMVSAFFKADGWSE
jgi:hypothetical protein